MPGATATQYPHFGPGAGFIVLDNVNCDGSEANLSQCQHIGFGVHNCRPSKDAGVFCSAGKSVHCIETLITIGQYLYAVNLLFMFIDL